MRVQEQDRYAARPSVPLSALLMAALETARGRRGMTRGAWLREAVEEKLAREGIEVTDEAMRPATRRPNLSERQAAGKRQGKG